MQCSHVKFSGSTISKTNILTILTTEPSLAIVWSVSHNDSIVLVLVLEFLINSLLPFTSLSTVKQD